LTSAESMLRNGDVTVRGFVRLVAYSDLYRSLFFENASAYRFVEVNCNHFLGRAPQSQAEISDHVQRYNASGYEAEIDSYLDSEEYLDSFGEDMVPYAKGASSQVGQSNVTFNRTFALNRGFAAKSSGQSAKLTSDLGANLSTKISAPTSVVGGYTNTAKRFRITVSKAKGGPQTRRSNQSYEVGYGQLSQQLQVIQKSGGRIVSISEV
jgi:phycoerythrin-associated linker protein